MGGSISSRHTVPAPPPIVTRYSAHGGRAGTDPDTPDGGGWEAAHRHMVAAEEPTLGPRRRLQHLIDLSIDLDDQVAGTRAAGIRAATPDPTGVGVRLRQLAARAATCFGEQVRPALAGAGVHLLGWSQLTDAERVAVTAFHDQQVLPLLVPMACDATHPFPRISSRSLNLAVVITEGRRQTPRFARVKIPSVVPRLVPLSAGTCSTARYVTVEDVVAAHLDRLFHGVPVVEHHRFRVTWGRPSRPTDHGCATVAAGGGARRCPVRLEISTTTTGWVLDKLHRYLGTANDLVWRLPDPLDLAALADLATLGEHPQAHRLRSTGAIATRGKDCHDGPRAWRHPQHSDRP